MRRTAMPLTVGLALLATTATAPAQNGGAVPPAPIPLRVVHADAVVVGKLGKVEEKNVSATPIAGAKAKVDFQVLELQVGEGLRGATKGDMIRFGFVPQHAGPEGAVAYRTGQEYLFFLNKHHHQPFYMAPFDYVPIDKRNDSYARALVLTRRCVKLLVDPQAGLKGKDAGDRLLTAGLLISRYRMYRPGLYGPETEPIPADESKLILNILADADWSTQVAPGSSFHLELTPGWLFSQLDVTFKDGWTAPDGGGYAVLYAAAKQWVKAHANTYRIQRLVPVAAGKSGTKDKKD